MVSIKNNNIFGVEHGSNYFLFFYNYKFPTNGIHWYFKEPIPWELELQWLSEHGLFKLVMNLSHINKTKRCQRQFGLAMVVVIQCKYMQIKHQKPAHDYVFWGGFTVCCIYFQIPQDL